MAQQIPMMELSQVKPQHQNSRSSNAKSMFSLIYFNNLTSVDVTMHFIFYQGAPSQILQKQSQEILLCLKS